jgi:glycosyltransferase 2 family protein
VSASNKALLTVLKYVLSIAGGGLLLWLSMRGVNFDELRTGFREADYLWVGLGLVVAVLSHWLRAARWVILFRAAGYESNTMNLFASVMVGNMVNQALPRAGEISRATVTARSEKIPLSVTFGTMVTDRIFDVIALGLLVLAVMALQYKEILRIMDKAFSTPPDPSAVVEPGMPLWQIIALAIIGLALLVFLVFRKRILASHLYARIKRFSKETWEAVLSVRKMDKPWLFILHTVGIWFCYILMTYLVFFSLSASSDLPLLFALTAFVMGGIGMVFPSPGGIGSYHFAIIMSFVAYGPSFGWTEQAARTVGTNLAFIIHTSQMIMMILVGLLCYLYLLWQIRLGKEESPSEP